MQTDIITNLLEGAGIKERCDAIGPGTESASRQAGSDGDHVLFRDAGVYETWAQRVLQGFESFKAQVPGEENQIW
jgi:hypothetical protein